mmetsp:Transcript_12126/g.48812  ORF Transcript_12126/g.48812 Transcript_12126/m.48812 type:complete len:281 (+) Transcript_12126:1212-2054(+)
MRPPPFNPKAAATAAASIAKKPSPMTSPAASRATRRSCEAGSFRRHASAAKAPTMRGSEKRGSRYIPTATATGETLLPRSAWRRLTRWRRDDGGFLLLSSRAGVSAKAPMSAPSRKKSAQNGPIYLNPPAKKTWPPVAASSAMSSQTRAVGVGSASDGTPSTATKSRYAATVYTTERLDPTSCATTWARGETSNSSPVLRSCIMSPACAAPASATAPATRFGTTRPGATNAKTTWAILPTPDTGLRSVWPSALMARAPTTPAHATATSVSLGARYSRSPA